MLKKSPIIKHSVVANIRIVTVLLSKFKQVTSLDLNYRQFTINFRHSYKAHRKRQPWCTYRGFQKSLASPATQERRQKRRARIEQLVRCDRVSDWEKKWMLWLGIQKLKDLSPKQLETTDKIESKVGGLK